MSQSSNNPQVRSPRTEEEREQLRAQGFHPVEYWVPDLSNPEVVAEIKRQAKLMAQHPENDAIDDWLDTVRDPGIWK